MPSPVIYQCRLLTDPGIIHKLAADLFDEHGWKIPVTERAECWISRHEDGNITEVGSSDYTKRGTVNGHEYDRSPEERNRKSGGNDIEEYKVIIWVLLSRLLIQLPLLHCDHLQYFSIFLNSLSSLPLSFSLLTPNSLRS